MARTRTSTRTKLQFWTRTPIVILLSIDVSSPLQTYLSSVGRDELESHAGRRLDGQIAGQPFREALDEGVAAGHHDGPVEGRPQIDVAHA